MLEQGNAPVGAFYGLAKIYLRQRRLDKASEIAERAMQLHGTHEAAMLTRGKVYRETGQLEEAEKVLRRCWPNRVATPRRGPPPCMSWGRCWIGNSVTTRRWRRCSRPRRSCA